VRANWVAIGLVLLAGCPAPGEGRRAENARRMLDPVVAALGAFHAVEKRYPATLDELVPRFLARVPEPHDDDPRYGYSPQPADGYRLEFRYGGPGMNVCNVTATHGWSCYGFY
jgi:hypothetical protein